MKRKFILTVVSVVAVASLAVAQDSLSDARRWHEIGPSGSGVSSLNPSPSNADVVYAVADDKGLYRSLDGGRTWRDFWIGEHTHNMHAVGLSVDDPNLIYAIRSGFAFQLHRSEDGGGSWERIPIRSDQVMYGDPYPRRIAVPTGAPSVIVYSGGGGLYRSDDRGDSWTTINGITAHFVEADPYRSGTVWLSGPISTLVSSDTGITWTEVPGMRGVIDMAFDPHDGDHILATASTGSPVYGEATLHRSFDGGETFSEVETSAPIFRGLSFDPDLPGVVYGASGVSGGDAGLYRSQDGGESWDRLERRALTGWTGMDVAIVGGNRPGVLAASAQGMASSEDGGISWQDANQGMPGPQIVNIKSLGPESPMLVASTFNGIFHSPDFGRTWWRSSGDVEEFHGGRWDPVVVDPKDPGKAYTVRTYLFRSDDGGRSFRKVSDERYLKSFQVDPHNSSRWFAASEFSGRLLRSIDEGQSWEEIGAEIEEYVDQYLLDPLNPGVVLVIDGHYSPNLYRSTDGGDSFEKIQLDGYFAFDRAELRYDPTTPHRVYGDRLVSEDGGFTWTERRYLPSDPVPLFPKPFVVDPVQADTLYGFLFYGIQWPDRVEYVREMVRSVDAGESWELFTKEGLPDDAYLTSLEVDRSGTYLYATVASEGRAHVYRILLRIPGPRQAGGRVP